MAFLGESLASEALKKCFFGSVKNVCSSIKNYKGNLKLLKDNNDSLSARKEDIVRTINQSVLDEASHEAQDWIQKVEELLGDDEVKDLLNEDLRRAKDQCCFGIFLCNLYHRYKMSRLAKSKADEMNRINGQTLQQVTVPKTIMDLPPIRSEHCEGLYSREELEQKILELLKNDEVDAVGIYGMGGIGKTTLAESIRDKAHKLMFDAILIVEVSQVVNVERIQNHIGAHFGISLDANHSRDQRATVLYNALLKESENKKILIVIDNIWKYLELKKVGIPTKGNCKLLFTTRDRSVCISMGLPKENIFNVSTLGVTESRNLFWERIRNVDKDSVETSLVDTLLKRCGGLPLAIVTLAGLLSCQRVSNWLYIADQLPESGEIYDVIELSYNSIETDKKRFFLLACLYPTGSVITVEDLKRYGIGLNLFQSKNCPAQFNLQANIWTDELISSSLLLEDRDDNDGRRRVKIHDVVRDVILSCAEKDGQKMMVESIPESHLDEYTAISLTDVTDFSCLRGMRFHKLEILILQCNWWDPESVDHDDGFQEMANLKVLHLSGLRFPLPKSIKALTCLRTLHLEYCILEDEDMEMVSELVGLFVLSLRGSDVKRLPYGMKNLSHLRLLDLNDCGSLTTIPANWIPNLTRLEELYMLTKNQLRWQDDSSEMEQNTPASIAGLSLLHHLKVLEIEVEKIEQVTVNDMEFITSIQKFKFYASRYYNERVNFLSKDFEVHIGGFFEWLRNYPCIKDVLAKSNRMKLSDEKGVLKSLVPNLDAKGFHVFEELELRELRGLKRICDGHVPPQMFCRLRTLQLSELQNLESYVLPIDVAPNLTTLYIRDCKKLKFIWMENGASTTQYQIRCLRYLTLRELPNLLHALGNDESVKSIDINNPQALFDANKIVFPSLEELEIYENSKYEKLLEWGISGRADPRFSPFPNLRNLYIDEANNIKIGIGSPSIAATLVNLETLRIEDCENMKQVVSKEPEEETHISSNTLIFPKLHLLRLYNLQKLECMYEGSYKVDFSTLNTLELVWVPNMTRFVGPNPTVDLLTKQMFFGLKHLKLCCLQNLEEYALPIDIAPNLITLSISDCKTVKFIWMENVTQREENHYEFPFLKVLKLRRLDNLMQALGNENVNDSSTCIGQPLFNTKIKFPSLEELWIEKCGRIEKLCEWDVPFLNLRKLEICACKNMKEVISEETEEETQLPSNIITFPNLNSLELSDLNKLECLYGGSYRVEFPALKEMELDKLPSFTTFIDLDNTMDFMSEKMEFPSLEDLQIRHVVALPTPTVKFYSLFQNLRTLTLSVLDWKHAFPKDMGRTQLNHLEILIIVRCYNMEAVVEEVDEEAMPSSSSSSPSLQFPSLTKIEMWECSKMRWFLLARHAHTVLHLPSLQEVQIRECDNMELFSNVEIKVSNLRVKITRNDCWRADSFHDSYSGDLNKYFQDSYKYYIGKLIGLDELQCMNEESYKLHLSTLNTLELDPAPDMTRLVNFFSKQMFLGLQHLTLRNMQNFKDYMLPIDAAPNLTTLSVIDCDMVKFIWMENVTQHEENHYEFSFLKVLTLESLDNLMQALGNENVNGISTSIGQPLFNTKIIFPSLEELRVEKCGRIEKLCEWDVPNLMQEISARASPPFCPFPNLRKLHIWFAKNVKIGIGSPSVVAALLHLESLHISGCQNMKQVISKERKEQTQLSSNIIQFPKLYSLHLGWLNKLECMYGGSYRVEFPALKKMVLDELPSITRFVGPDNTMDFISKQVEFPSLQDLEICQVVAVATPSINFYSLFQNLRKLTLSWLNWKHAFSKDMVATNGLIQLNNLEILYIKECENMEAVVEEVDDEALPSSSSSSPSLEFPRLTSIHLWECSKMRWFLLAKHAHTVLHLPCLQKVDIRGCNNMELFSNVEIKVPNLARVEVNRFFDLKARRFHNSYNGDLNKYFYDSQRNNAREKQQDEDEDEDEDEEVDEDDNEDDDEDEDDSD